MLSNSVLKMESQENRKMKILILAAFLMISSWTASISASIDSESPVAVVAVLGVVTSVSRSEFDSKYQTFFKAQWQNCSSCEVINLTPYNEKGELNRAALPQAVEKAAGLVRILYVDWNEVADGENRAALEALKTVSKNGVLVLGPVGEPANDKPGAALNRTLLGQVPDAVIIGELDEKESFPKRSFYGPEILTALKPPRGVDEASRYFAAKLTQEWTHKTQAEWITHFRARKTLSKRLWPGMDELFGR